MKLGTVGAEFQNSQLSGSLATFFGSIATRQGSAFVLRPGGQLLYLNKSRHSLDCHKIDRFRVKFSPQGHPGALILSFFFSIAFQAFAFKQNLRDSCIYSNNQEIVLDHLITCLLQCLHSAFVTQPIYSLPSWVSIFGVNLHGLSMDLGVQSRLSG